MHRIVALAACALTLACGLEPRDNFIGSYNANQTGSVTLEGQTSQMDPKTGTMEITAAAQEGKIAIKDSDCALVGTVISDSSFTIDPVTCPSQSNGNCSSISLKVTAGTGSLNGKVLTINMSGDVVATCDGSTFNGTFQMSTNATKL